ncbi:RHS repeat protein [Aspergillus costaricaensis CBS 115574]|uniref:RHS repeat protein n=1 Tax=Aspergillus costaricaensis CBS 115574 TaxID=1448317 RepID=A0ACD1HYQ0_9EURO|nr:RHS repeat protein [Aspergillus costaricaensis CBS 115574]RAK83114.1 RHS repeat protein [Aspergillus costaricaensis CBS 115574]
MSIYSQGFNFNSYIEKGVDPRTGQYNCSISLYEVPAGVRNCPPLNLFLHYNPLNSDDVGLGKGWSFGNLSTYDQNSKTLMLSTGENYKVTETTSSVFVADQKLKDFAFQKTGTMGYRVILKSGQVEVLSNFNRSTVSSDSQNLLEVAYNTYTTITRAPGTAEAATFTLVKQNNQLAELRLPLDGSPAWKFTYGTGGLTNVTSPTGATEEISYKTPGFSLPSGAPVSSIPYVISHTARPFHDQPAIQTTYSYSDRNFLGYGGGRNWNNDGDNLYLTPADYEYTSTAQIVGGTTTKHTYNKFHLEVSREQQKGTKQVTQTTTYYALSNTSFDSQPAQYKLPKAQTTTYRNTSTGSSRAETSQFTFDDWGNQTSETTPSGLATTREYYAAAGDSASGQVLCPADPHGFQNYLKLEIVTPAASAYQTPTRAHDYTYLQIPTVADALTDYHVVAQRRVMTEDSQTLATTDYTYINQPQSSDHGRRQQQVSRLLNKNPTTYKWTYSTSSSELTETTTMTSFDSQTTQEETTSSLISGLTLATKDRAGTKTTQQYDAIGRVIQTSTATGTAFEATKKHEYVILSKAVGWQVTVTDTKGVQTRYFTDGMDRVVRVEAQDDDGSWDKYQTYTGTFRVIRERQYNSIDQCSTEVDIDWLRTSGTPKELRTTRSFEYDDWGQVYKVTKNSGAVQLSETDPISLTLSVGNEGEGQTRIQYNAFQAPIAESLVQSTGAVEGTIEYAYDGLGRRRRLTDALGRATQYSYDSFDRVVQTTWADGHAITTQYAAQTTAALPVAINLQGTTGFSEQSFDGLERSLYTMVGGRKTSNIYQGGAPVPAQVTNPKGARSEHMYEPALDYALTRRVTNDKTDAYQYDKQTGNVLQLDSSLAPANLSYYPSSLLSQETIQTAEGARAVEYVYSQAGKLQEYTDVTGKQHVIQYDEYGRRQEISVGTLKTTLSYDRSDRVTMTVTQDSRQSVALTVKISYDDFGREIRRTVSNGATLVSQTTQSYGATGLITTRSRSDGNNTQMRRETFGYDSLSRLVDYQCQGTQPPVDERGRAIRRQQFTLNSYDGFTQIQTTFVDGSNNLQVYTYSAQDPTQLVRITNSHSDEPAVIDLEYDENGCLTRDEQGRTLVYNASRLLAAVYDSQNQLLCEYGYDATDRLVRQSIPNEPDTQFFYRGDSLIAITKGEQNQTSFMSDGEVYWGEVQQQGSGNVHTQIWASDAHHSVSTWLDPQDADQVHDQAYTPYGISTGGGAAIGFNGQWRDPITGWYHLGSGYRVYSPSLKTFLQPDAWTPFTSGEINPYAYCLADPINRADPSGHFSWLRTLIQFAAGVAVGIAFTVLTGGAGFGLAFTVLAGAVLQGLTSAASGAVYDRITGTKPTLSSIGNDLFSGFVGGIAGGVAGASVNLETGGLLKIALAEAGTSAIITGLQAKTNASIKMTMRRFTSAPVATSSSTAAGSKVDTSSITPGRIPDLPLEKLRQRKSAVSWDDSSAVSARTTSRETVKVENVSSNSLMGSGGGGGFDGSLFTLHLSPDHRVSFTIDAQAAHVPAWDVTGASLSTAAYQLAGLSSLA